MPCTRQPSATRSTVPAGRSREAATKCPSGPRTSACALLGEERGELQDVRAAEAEAPPGRRAAAAELHDDPVVRLDVELEAAEGPRLQDAVEARVAEREVRVLRVERALLGLGLALAELVAHRRGAGDELLGDVRRGDGHAGISTRPRDRAAPSPAATWRPGSSPAPGRSCRRRSSRRLQPVPAAAEPAAVDAPGERERVEPGDAGAREGPDRHVADARATPRRPLRRRTHCPSPLRTPERRAWIANVVRAASVAR